MRRRQPRRVHAVLVDTRVAALQQAITRTLLAIPADRQALTRHLVQVVQIARCYASDERALRLGVESAGGVEGIALDEVVHAHAVGVQLALVERAGRGSGRGRGGSGRAGDGSATSCSERDLRVRDCLAAGVGGSHDDGTALSRGAPDDAVAGSRTGHRDPAAGDGLSGEHSGGAGTGCRHACAGVSVSATRCDAHTSRILCRTAAICHDYRRESTSVAETG